MSYSFEIIGVAPILTFFNYQQRMEEPTRQSQTHLGSYHCTLDGFIESTKLIPQKPDWNWDDVINTMVNFWLSHEEKVRYWQNEFKEAEKDTIIVAKVVNFDCLRHEFEALFQE